MIRSFACHETEKLFNDESSRRLPTQIQRVARRKLLVLHQARNLQDLRSASVAHRKSANFKKVSKEFGLDSKDTITVFEEILSDATAMVEFLHSSLVKPEAESPQA